MKKHDFIALETALYAASVLCDVNAPLTPPEMLWDKSYVNAIETALVKHNYVPLLALLRDERPIHPMLLPVLADAIQAKGERKQPGRKPKLTSGEALMVARQVQHMRLTGKTQDGKELKSSSKANVIRNVAKEWGVSMSTIKRAYEEHVPVYRRPGNQLTIA